jgi:RNA polymerase sigma factor (sigma-70 family)
MRDFERLIPFAAAVARRAGVRGQDVGDVVGDVAVLLLSSDVEPENPRAYVAVVTRRAVVSAWRTRRRFPVLVDAETFPGAVDDEGGPEREEGPAFADLTAAEGRAVRLHYFGGEPVAAVARRMRTTPGAVRVLLCRARARLRESDAAGRPVFEAVRS